MNEDETKTLICLDQFLKATCLVETGGMAKQVIQGGEVAVNGQIETRRRRKLVADDHITIDGDTFRVGDAFVDDDEVDVESDQSDGDQNNAEVTSADNVNDNQPHLGDDTAQDEQSTSQGGD